MYLVTILKNTEKSNGLFFISGEISHKIYLLFSRHSIRASTNGIIKPKMLNQTGMRKPPTVIST
jgi:hypothetical protein